MLGSIPAVNDTSHHLRSTRSACFWTVGEKLHTGTQKNPGRAEKLCSSVQRCVGAEAVTWLPGFSVPVSQCDSGCRRVQTFPPHSSVAGLADISEDGVFGDGGHGVGVGLVRGAWCDAKEAILWVNGSQFTCREDGIMPQTLRMDRFQLQTLLLETQT